jgi:glycerophosphoryl diester phosphodiesterase
MVYMYIAAAYAVICYTFFKFPHLLHKPLAGGVKKIRKRDPVWIIAHRGGSFEEPENTMPAFRNAVMLGVDVLELDVYATVDGEIIISHDNNLMRTCGKDVNITQIQYADLPPMLSTFKTHFGPSATTFPGQYTLPRLDELFEEFPGYPVCIEVKEVNEVAVEGIARVVEKYGRSSYDTVINAVKGPGAT